MRIASILSALSVVSGTAATVTIVLVLVVAVMHRVVFGFGLLQWGMISILLYLAAIWLKLGAIYHKQ